MRASEIGPLASDQPDERRRHQLDRGTAQVGSRIAPDIRGLAEEWLRAHTTGRPHQRIERQPGGSLLGRNQLVEIGLADRRHCGK